MRAATIYETERTEMRVVTPRTRRSCSHRPGERGSSAVEFALVASLVLVPLLFGIVAFGIGFSQKLSLNSAVRDGARFGSVGLYAAQAGTPRTCRDVLDQTRANSGTIGLKPADVEVTVTVGSVVKCRVVGSTYSGTGLTDLPCAGAGDVDNLGVAATFRARLSIPPVLTRTVDLRSKGVYRCEYSG